MTSYDPPAGHATPIEGAKMPHHIAIIMDGNGRWALNQSMPRREGHRAGQKKLRDVIRYCTDLGIKVLSVYGFSTENWQRPPHEISFLLQLLKTTIQNELDEWQSAGLNIRFLGDWCGFDRTTQQLLHRAEDATKHNTAIQLNVMLNYGGRREIVQAVMAYQKAGYNMQDLTESALSSYLYTSDVSDPDMLIRTGGDVRLSNFMLWQMAYCELMFVPTFWPDFSRSDLMSAIHEFQHRQRRFGGLSS